MALGHAFSHEREHDQAFNAYLMAEKEMRGLSIIFQSLKIDVILRLVITFQALS